MTAQQRVDRARHAALSRTTVEHHLKALAGEELTDEQCDALAALLRNARAGA
jgi:hypothetical protein